jgi:hypothetical protein
MKLPRAKECRIQGSIPCLEVLLLGLILEEDQMETTYLCVKVPCLDPSSSNLLLVSRNILK